MRARLRSLARERRRFGYRRLGLLLARQGLRPNPAIRAEEYAGPPLANPVRLAHRGYNAPPCCGPYHFFEATSFSTALSSIASASSFFSRAFSASKVRSRRASDTSRPPNFAFHC